MLSALFVVAHSQRPYVLARSACASGRASAASDGFQSKFAPVLLCVSFLAENEGGNQFGLSPFIPGELKSIWNHRQHTLS